jgi:hypothetical protein
MSVGAYVSKCAVTTSALILGIHDRKIAQNVNRVFSRTLVTVCACPFFERVNDIAAILTYV